VSLNKKSFSVWLAFHLLIICLFFIFGKLIIDTSLFSILPDSNPVQQLSEVEQSISSKLNSGLTVLIGHEDFSAAKRISDQFVPDMRSIQGIKEIQYELNTNAVFDIQKYLHKYRYHFLSPDVEQFLKDGNISALSERAFFSLSSPVSMGSLDFLDEDPYLLANESLQYFLNSGVLGKMAVGIRDSLLSRDYDGKSWILVTMKSGFDGSTVELEENPIPVLLELADDYKQKNPAVEFIFSGVPFHSYDSAQKSRREISLLSTLSSLFIVFLILLIFRSIQPLVATLIAIGSGIVTGLATTLIIFQDIHIFTIVFGTSLIGISVDYSFHYFTEWSEQIDNKTVLKKILPGISIGLITTILSYGAFTISSFPLLQQIAVFSIAGLISTYISVLFLYPNLGKAKEKTRLSSDKAAEIIKRIFQVPARFPAILSYFIIFALILFVVFGLKDFKLSNNIRDLYKMSPHLLGWENKSSEILDHGSSGIYFLIEGNNLEENLLKEEILTETLISYSEKEYLESYLGLSTLLPSKKTQKKNRQLISEKLFPRMMEQLSFLGYDHSVFEHNLEQFTKSENQFMDINDLNSLPLNSLTDALHSGDINGKYYTSVLLFGITDLPKLKDLAEGLQGVYLVNKADDTSRTLEELSKLALIIILFSYLSIFIGLLFRYGVKGSLRIVLIPIAASLLTLSLISIVQLPVNLFVVVGLILIPGMGTDYIILLSESEKNQKSVLLSITLSMLTSVLAFGLLGFTSLAGVFGLTVSFGVFMTYMLTLFFSKKLI
jgi:predicted exporter